MPKFQPSLNHHQIDNDQEEGYMQYSSLPKVTCFIDTNNTNEQMYLYKFRLELSNEDEIKRRKVHQFLETCVGKAAFLDFDSGK